jgi:hypothetical protein
MNGYKIGDRVKTVYGTGQIVCFETISDKYPRAGVRHIETPRYFDDGEIMFFFFNEIELVEK